MNILVILLFLLIVSFSIRSIKKKMYEIGVLRALGCSINQVSKTFILQVIYIVLLSCILSTVLILFSNIYINELLVTKLSEFTNNKDILNIKMIYLDYSILLIVYSLMFIITLASSVIPVLCIRKIKPIDIIKNNE
jgi:ABC-type lipoprotein release transport system permease subunit